MIEGSKVKEGFAFHESRSSNLIMYLDARTFATLLLCTPDTDFKLCFKIKVYVVTCNY